MLYKFIEEKSFSSLINLDSENQVQVLIKFYLWCMTLHKNWNFPSRISSVSRSFPQIWSHLLKKLSMENFISCAAWISVLFLEARSELLDISEEFDRVWYVQIENHRYLRSFIKTLASKVSRWQISILLIGWNFHWELISASVLQKSILVLLLFLMIFHTIWY